MKSNLKFSFSFFIVSLITLVSSIFAWMSIMNVSSLDGVNSNITDFRNLIKFEIKRNDDEFNVIKSIVDIEQYFLKTRPGEVYTFKITFDNKSNFDISFVTNFINVENDYTTNNGSNLYDIRDVFYIEDGKIEISNKPDVILIPNSSNSVTKFGQELNLYRLSNLFSYEDDVTVLPLYTIEADEILTITFKLVFDINTKDVNYTSNILKFEGLYIFGQNE